MYNQNHILVTGGTGYIGSHTVVELMSAGYTVTIVDNLAESDIGVLDGIEKLAGCRPNFIQADLRDRVALAEVFAKDTFDAVIHFAGYKAVGDSVARPLWYYDNNVVGSTNLLGVMVEYGVKHIVFSSSCTVYGNPEQLPVTEDSRLYPTNPYGRTKLTVELMLQDLCVADAEFQAVALRYFNPVGAHESGIIGESPKGIPNNLMPYICQVASGEREFLQIFGGDYPTPDGTCIRDYLHVVDLAQAHVAALEARNPRSEVGLPRLTRGGRKSDHGLRTTDQRPDNFTALNLGTGRGHSVLAMVETFRQVNGVDVPYKIVARRPGDAISCYCEPGLAAERLGWQASRELAAMCRDAWRWQKAAGSS